MKYKVVAKVTKGTSLAILEEKEGWYHVRLEGGKEAWISKTATTEGAKAHPAPAPSPSRASSSSSPSSSTPSTAVQSPKPKSPM
jgi:uncharacterized protein YgiM (DUF1202 family)